MSVPVLRSWDGTAWVPPAPYVPPPGAWTPAGLSPSGWWDASQITGKSDGDSMAGWADVSGTGYDLTGTATYEASVLGGRAVVRLNGVSDKLASSTGKAFSHLFIVADHTSTAFSNYDGLVTNTSSAYVLIGKSGTTLFYPLSGSAVAYKDGTTVGQTVIPAPMGGVAALYSLSAAASLLSSALPLLIGNDRGLAGRFWRGDIAEVLIFPFVLTDADRQKTEGYLAWKYGLEANLPSDHPYKSAGP